MSKTPNEDPGPSRLTVLKNTFNYVKDSAPVKIVTGSAVGRAIGVELIACFKFLINVRYNLAS
jgi:hypothetical protein